MDPKVLTLFDDDAFQPPPPKAKAVRKEKEQAGNDVPIARQDGEMEPVMQENAGAGQPDYVAEEIVAEKTSEKPELSEEGDDNVLDRQMRAALIESDYTQYVYKEMPAAQLQQPVKGGGIVFEGVVERKKAAQKADIAEVLPQPAADPEPEDKAEALPEWQLESRYYSIGEVAKLFGVNNSHIRFWTTQFKMKPRTTRKGDRLYNVDDINQLRLIHHLVKEKKHTIKGAKEKLKDKDTVGIQLDLKTSLVKLRDLLTEMRDKL